MSFNTTKLAFTIACSLLLGAVGFSQQAPRSVPLDRKSQMLNLTDAQKSKLQPLLESQHKQVQAIRQDSALTAQQKQAKIHQVRVATHRQLMSLLTPEQQRQMRAMRHEDTPGTHRDYGRGMGPDMQPAPPAPPRE